MQRAVLVIIIPLLFGVCATKATVDKNKEELVFRGTVLQVGAHPKALSGIIAVYQLAKYRVERVCRGNYNGEEIVVDHLMLNGYELKDIRVGDTVCVSVTKSNKIFDRYDAEGIRKPSDTVEVYYIGGQVDPSRVQECDC